MTHTAAASSNTSVAHNHPASYPPPAAASQWPPVWASCPSTVCSLVSEPPTLSGQSVVNMTHTAAASNNNIVANNHPASYPPPDAASQWSPVWACCPSTVCSLVSEPPALSGQSVVNKTHTSAASSNNIVAHNHPASYPPPDAASQWSPVWACCPSTVCSLVSEPPALSGQSVVNMTHTSAAFRNTSVAHDHPASCPPPAAASQWPPVWASCPSTVCSLVSEPPTLSGQSIVNMTHTAAASNNNIVANNHPASCPPPAAASQWSPVWASCPSAVCSLVSEPPTSSGQSAVNMTHTAAASSNNIVAHLLSQTARMPTVASCPAANHSLATLGRTITTGPRMAVSSTGLVASQGSSSSTPASALVRSLLPSTVNPPSSLVLVSSVPGQTGVSRAVPAQQGAAAALVVTPAASGHVKVIDLTMEIDPAASKQAGKVVAPGGMRAMVPQHIVSVRQMTPITQTIPSSAILLSSPAGTQIVNAGNIQRPGMLQMVTIANFQSLQPGSIFTVMPGQTGSMVRPPATAPTFTTNTRDSSLVMAQPFPAAVTFVRRPITVLASNNNLRPVLTPMGANNGLTTGRAPVALTTARPGVPAAALGPSHPDGATHMQVVTIANPQSLRPGSTFPVMPGQTGSMVRPPATAPTFTTNARDYSSLIMPLPAAFTFVRHPATVLAGTNNLHPVLTPMGANNGLTAGRAPVAQTIARPGVPAAVSGPLQPDGATHMQVVTIANPQSLRPGSIFPVMPGQTGSMVRPPATAPTFTTNTRDSSSLIMPLPAAFTFVRHPATVFAGTNNLRPVLTPMGANNGLTAGRAPVALTTAQPGVPAAAWGPSQPDGATHMQVVTIGNPQSLRPGSIFPVLPEQTGSMVRHPATAPTFTTNTRDSSSLIMPLPAAFTFVRHPATVFADTNNLRPVLTPMGANNGLTVGRAPVALTTARPGVPAAASGPSQPDGATHMQVVTIGNPQSLRPGSIFPVMPEQTGSMVRPPATASTFTTNTRDSSSLIMPLPATFSVVRHPATVFAGTNNLRPVLTPMGANNGLTAGRAPVALTTARPGVPAAASGPSQPDGATHMQPLISILAKKNIHPAPLPESVCPKGLPADLKSPPPSPGLKILRSKQGIMLSWNMSIPTECVDIASYQVFAYRKTNAAPQTSLWKKVGDVKALPLPMACTLLQYQDGSKYYFAVRAIDVHGRSGPFSEPSYIFLTKKDK